MNHTSRGVALLVLSLASGAAAAQGAVFGLYVEADAGRTHFDLEKAGLDNWSEMPADASSLDQRDMGYALTFGFRFSPYLAIEAGYLDLGKTRYLIEDDGVSARLDLGSKGPTMALIGSLPINAAFSLEGRAGLYFSDVDVGATILVGTLAGLGLMEVQASGADPGWFIGAAAAVSFDDRWSVRAGYDYFDGKAAGLRHPVQGTELDSRAGRWKIGLRYTFW